MANTLKRKKERDALDTLLLHYRFWGLAAMSFFLVFLALLSAAFFAKEGDIILLAGPLLTGFLWLGATVVSRHIYVLLKSYLGKKVTIFQFVSTQLVVLLFPFVYRKLRNEAALYRRTMTDESGRRQ